jgi:hypothetical protein
LKDPSTIFFMSLGPHVGAQSLCACPPSAIKGEACDVTRNLRLSSSYKPSSNTSHSGVGYYALTARTTLNPRVFLCTAPSLQQSSETPKPLLISGLRAGALRHPAGDLLSDIFVLNFLTLCWKGAQQNALSHHAYLPQDPRREGGPGELNLSPPQSNHKDEIQTSESCPHPC